MCGTRLNGSLQSPTQSVSFKLDGLMSDIQESIEIVDDERSTIQGELFKVGKNFGSYKPRFFVLRGQFLFQFRSEVEKSIPIETIFLQGCYIEKIRKENGKLFGVKITTVTQDHDDKEKRLYHEKESVIKRWIICLRRAAKTQKVESFYKIDEEYFAKGHYSTIHTAVCKRTGKKYAIKKVSKSQMTNEEEINWRNEILILRLVKHESVVSMINMFENLKYIFIILPHAEGGDLYDRMKEIYDETGCGMKESDAKQIAWKLLDATSYLHALGIVHRDLKPSNILLKEKNENTSIYVIDFGLSRFSTPTGSLTYPCGTCEFMAPEVFSGNGYDKAVDVWSIGVILHFLLAAYLPFDSQLENSIERKQKVKHDILTKEITFKHRVWDRVSHEAISLCCRLLDKNPAKRATIAQALESAWFESMLDDMNSEQCFSSPGKSPVPSLPSEDFLNPKMTKVSQMSSVHSS